MATKTKNGLVTFVVPEGDIQEMFYAMDERAGKLKQMGAVSAQDKGVELAHLKDNLLTQAKAQGWKSF